MIAVTDLDPRLPEAQNEAILPLMRAPYRKLCLVANAGSPAGGVTVGARARPHHCAKLTLLSPPVPSYRSGAGLMPLATGNRAAGDSCAVRSVTLVDSLFN
jgi:hypothetical protein